MFEDILLEKLAEGYDDDTLELLIKEAQREAESKKEASFDISEDDALALADYLGEDEVDSILQDVEAEKTAAAYYELGQVMARGFQEELEKLAAQNKEAEEGKGMPPELLAKMKAKAEEGKKEDKKEDKGDDKGEYKKDMKEEEKKSSNAEVYRALATLAEAGLLDKLKS